MDVLTDNGICGHPIGRKAFFPFRGNIVFNPNSPGCGMHRHTLPPTKTCHLFSLFTVSIPLLCAHSAWTQTAAAALKKALSVFQVTTGSHRS